MAFIVLIAGFLLPSTQMLHAEQMDMHHDMMDMDCQDGSCESVPSQSSCLKHCLSQIALSDYHQGVISVRTEAPMLIFAKHTYIELEDSRSSTAEIFNTGPPSQRARHLTIQKKE